MSNIQGMEVDGVRALARRCGTTAHELRQTVTQIDGLLASSWWEGGDADGFRTTWRSQRRPTVGIVATKLEAIRDHLLKQVREQELASQGSGTGTGGFGPSRWGPDQPLPSPPGLDDWLRRHNPQLDRLRHFLERAGKVAGVVVTAAAPAPVAFLKWLTGPKGPAVEDVTRLVPGLQRWFGNLMDSAMRVPAIRDFIGKWLGFEYHADGDYYTTNEHSIQSHGGFHPLFDRVGKLLGMDLDDEVIHFSANGVDYKLEFWKGGYGSGGAFGGEIGLYTHRHDSTGWRGVLEKIPGFYSTAQGDDQIRMTQTIYNKETGEVYFTNDNAGSRDGDHFWNLAIRTDPSVPHEQLGQRGTLYVEDPAVRDAMLQAMQGRDGVRAWVNAEGAIEYEWE